MAIKRTAIIYPDDDFALIVFIRYLHQAGQWQRGMGGCHRCFVENLAICRRLAVKAFDIDTGLTTFFTVCSTVEEAVEELA